MTLPAANPDDAEDRSLVAAFLATRSEAAFRRLYRRHTAAVFGTLLHLTGADQAEAEDLAQETWLRAIAALERFAWRSALRTWLRGIAINCWRERMRGLRWEAPGDDETDDPPAPAGLHPVDRIVLREALNALAPGYRAVLVLHDIEGYRHEEIAAALGIAPGTSKSQLARARAALRRICR